MKRVTLIVEDTSVPPLISTLNKRLGVSINHFFVNSFSWKDFARFIKESRNEKTK